jgi:hypothetical protein
MARIAVLVGALASFAFARGAPAQRTPASRGGFWYAIGLAPGWARMSCDICGADRRLGVSAFVRMGGAAGQRVRLGGELAAWRERAGGVTQNLTSFSAAAYFYPTRRRTMYLKGGVGYVTHRANDGTDVITSTGIGPQLGIGYEWPAGRRWLVGPFFNYGVGALAGGVKFNGGQATDVVTISFFQVGLAAQRR